MKYLCLIIILAFVIAQNYSDHGGVKAAPRIGFVSRNGIQFILNGKPFYSNGFNAYWLAYEATDPNTRFKITNAFQTATSHGLTIARTWGFLDGGYRALQTAPGSYNEKTFQGLDFAIAEAKRFGIKLIIVFVNNWTDYGGKKQYVDWAKSKGQNVATDDDFYTNPLTKDFYKNHIKTMVNRVNTFTKVAYKDEPTIMAWELMNELRCHTDPSGKTVMAWINEMAPYVKSLDPNHLLSIGLEGFYGDSSPPERKASLNPASGSEGTDFIANHNLDAIDFASAHSYTDAWSPKLKEKSRLHFLRRWLNAHIKDAQNILKKPLIIGEFGTANDTTLSERDAVYTITYDTVYASAKKGGSGAGALFWQLSSDGNDVLRERSSTVKIISEESRKLGLISGKGKLRRKIKN